MITAKQTMEKVCDMIVCDGGVMEFIFNDVVRLINTGAVNFESYQNNYRLPKILMVTALSNAAAVYAPICPVSKQEVENLKKF